MKSPWQQIGIKQWATRQPLAVLAIGGAVAAVTGGVLLLHTSEQPPTAMGHSPTARVGGVTTNTSSGPKNTSSVAGKPATKTPPPTAPAAGSSAPAAIPAPPPPTPFSVLGLASWRLTLPVETAHKGSPDEINQPELASFTSPPYFELTPAKNGVIFQANAGGATTKNSHYPRSELREMTANGSTEASWSNAGGIHTMVVREAITHVPAVKPEVVAAQIHDADDDVVMVKLSGSRLFVEGSSKSLGDLDANYVLGTVYTVKIVASNGHITVYYNDALKVDYVKSGSGFYFKAGCYTQSNVSKGDTADAYAQVVMYGVQVLHT